MGANSRELRHMAMLYLFALIYHDFHTKYAQESQYDFHIEMFLRLYVNNNE